MANLSRPIRVVVQLSKNEKKLLLQKIKKSSSGTISNYARHMLLNGKIINIDLRPLNKLSTEVSRIGNNINQIARIANESRNISNEEILKIQKYQSEIVEVIGDMHRKYLQEMTDGSYKN